MQPLHACACMCRLTSHSNCCRRYFIFHYCFVTCGFNRIKSGYMPSPSWSQLPLLTTRCAISTRPPAMPCSAVQPFCGRSMLFVLHTPFCGAKPCPRMNERGRDETGTTNKPACPDALPAGRVLNSLASPHACVCSHATLHEKPPPPLPTPLPPSLPAPRPRPAAHGAPLCFPSATLGCSSCPKNRPINALSTAQQSQHR